MSDNPFQGIEITIPKDQHKLFEIYCKPKPGSIPSLNKTPFQRMIDLWFLSICVAIRHKLNPKQIKKDKAVQITDGSILAQDPWRITAITLIAVDKKGMNIILQPRVMMTLANGLAASGLPFVAKMLAGDLSEPISKQNSRAIWNLSDEIASILRGEGSEYDL